MWVAGTQAGSLVSSFLPISTIQKLDSELGSVPEDCRAYLVNVSIEIKQDRE